MKVVKGGSCGSVTARALEVDTRVGVRPEQTSGWGIGFRLAMDVEEGDPLG